MQFYVHYTISIVILFKLPLIRLHYIFPCYLDRATDPESIDSAIERKIDKRLKWWQCLENYNYEEIR